MLRHDIPSIIIPIDSIDIDRAERQRREIITTDLEPSLREKGLIHPILVQAGLGPGRWSLIAGERRLTAATRIGWVSIPARDATGLNARELKLIELEENIRRVELPWQDKLAAIVQIHETYLEDDPDWTGKATAELIGLSEGDVSLFLTIAAEAKAKPELLDKPKAREAYNVIGRAASRRQGEALQELFESMKEALPEDEGQALGEAVESEAEAKARLEAERGEEILQESFLSWAPAYTGPKFNLIHCDFPYGVELFSREFGQRGGAKPYGDSKDIYFGLLESLLDNLDRLMSLSGHLVFWYSMKYDRETKLLFAERAPSLDFTTHPFVWVKSDNAGIIGDARRDLRHTYEVALVARRGERQVVKSVADCYSAPTDRALHPSTKPEPMLRHLFSALVDEHTSLLDPTCGAGSALRAADSLGAARVQGLEIDLDYASAARTALRNARRLRVASATL